MDKNTDYNIRLCSVYKDKISNWTEIYKVKTKNFAVNSIILCEEEKGNEYLQKLLEWTGKKEMELLYRGTRDGSGSDIFHNKCNNKGATLCLCKNDKGNIFGGYASVAWTSRQNYEYDYNSFLFTLTNIHKTVPTKFPIYQNHQYAIYDSSGNGPTFGGGNDLQINNNFLNSNSSSNLGYSYQDVLGKGNSIFSGDANNSNIKIKELEVFKFK